MPGGDGTGPAGLGPRTGRGLGNCAPTTEATKTAFGFGRGLGRGRGRGFGRGLGFGFRKNLTENNTESTTQNK